MKDDDNMRQPSTPRRPDWSACRSPRGPNLVIIVESLGLSVCLDPPFVSFHTLNGLSSTTYTMLPSGLTATSWGFCSPPGTFHVPDNSPDSMETMYPVGFLPKGFRLNSGPDTAWSWPPGTIKTM